MVAPDQAGNGIGLWLLSYAEEPAPTGTTHCALFTGQHSTRNIALYLRAGYVLTSADRTPDGTVYLTKDLNSAREGNRLPDVAVAPVAGQPTG